LHGTNLALALVRHSLASALLTGLVTGCASAEQAISQVKQDSAKLFNTAPVPASERPAPAAGSGIAGSELDGIFKKFPITNDQHPEQYPRAAITITSVSPSTFRTGGSSSAECISFDVRLWSSATKSQLFKDMKMCAPQRSRDVPFYTLLTWPRRGGEPGNSGAVRTDGPRRPATNFPTDAALVDAWFDSPSSRGINFIGSILYQMGYDWAQPGEARVWIVSVPKN